MSGGRKQKDGKRKKTRVRARNPVARSPLLRKGSAHETPKSGERRKAKEALRTELADTDRRGDRDGD